MVICQTFTALILLLQKTKNHGKINNQTVRQYISVELQ